MNDFKTLCEMDVGSLIKSVMGIKAAGEVAQPEPPQQQSFVIQPDSGVGTTGKLNGDSGKNIQVSKSEDGGLMIKSADMNINLNKQVADAIAQFMKGGIKENFAYGHEDPMEQEALNELSQKYDWYIKTNKIINPEMKDVLYRAMESGYNIGKAISNMLTKHGKI